MINEPLSNITITSLIVHFDPRVAPVALGFLITLFTIFGKIIQMNFRNVIVSIVISLFVAGCVTAPEPLTKKNSDLTQGMVQMNLEVGKTSKAEVLETFGAPNITTRDGNGDEVWTYQRQAQATQSSSQDGYWTIIFAGKSSSASGFETSSRMITLIIKFDNKDIVTDFRSRESNF